MLSARIQSFRFVKTPPTLRSVISSFSLTFRSLGVRGLGVSWVEVVPECRELQMPKG